MAIQAMNIAGITPIVNIGETRDEAQFAPHYSFVYQCHPCVLGDINWQFPDSIV